MTVTVSVYGLTFAYGSARSYSGLDRFGRVVDQTWRDTQGTPVVKGQFKYGSVMWHSRPRLCIGRPAAETPAPGRAHTRRRMCHTCDGLDRLLTADRGALTGGPPPTGITSRTFKQHLSLEGLANLRRRKNWMSPFPINGWLVPGTPY